MIIKPLNFCNIEKDDVIKAYRKFPDITITIFLI